MDRCSFGGFFQLRTGNCFAKLLIAVFLFIAIQTQAQAQVMSYRAFGPSAEGKPRQLVIVLHGLGGNSNSELGTALFLARILPDTRFILPDAPFSMPEAETETEFQWYPSPLHGNDQSVTLAGIRQSAGILSTFIEEESRRLGLEIPDVVLVGFSQGATMAIYTALYHRPFLGGAVAYSGFLPEENFPDDIIGRYKNVPKLYLVHGEQDDVVPVLRHYDVLRRLRRYNYPVKSTVYGDLGHYISEAGLMTGADFIRRLQRN